MGLSFGAGHGAAQGALGQNAAEVLAVLDGAAHVGDRRRRRDRVGGGSLVGFLAGGLPDERRAGCFDVKRGRRDRPQGNPRAGDGVAVELDPGAGRNHRDVHLVARDKAQVVGP